MTSLTIAAFLTSAAVPKCLAAETSLEGKLFSSLKHLIVASEALNEA